MKHLFRGKWYRLVPFHAKKAKYGGDCDSPDCLDKQMRLPYRGTTERSLEYNIHEALHACMWDVSDEAVTETAKDIAHLLWRLGWRKFKSTESK